MTQTTGIEELLEATKAKRDNGSAQEARGAGLGEWCAADDDTVPPPRGWLLGNSFCRGFVSSLLAPGGVGKSALRLLQAIAFVTGRPLTDERVFKPGRALIVSLEDDADELRRRVRAARIYHKISPDELEGLYLSAPGIAAGKLMLMVANARASIAETGELAAHVEEVVRRRQIDLLIIDPLIKAHGLPENDNKLMDQLAQLLAGLVAKCDIALDVPHHVSKGTVEPGNPDKSRGASATVDAARLVHTLAPMRPDEAQIFNITEDERRSYVRYDRAKLNVARTAGGARWFKLVGVSIDNATIDYPAGDNVQTLERWEPQGIWAGLDVIVINQILNKIDGGLDGGNFYTDAAKAPGREAWRVVGDVAPQKSETQARAVIRAWIKSGVLVSFDYENPATRKTVRGLKVDDAKRPS